MSAAAPIAALTPTGRVLILVVGFLGWFCAGMHMSITQLTGQAAAIDLLDRTGELDAARYQALSKLKAITASAADDLEWQRGRALVGQWFAWQQCAFLFGAAAGGLVFGWVGDRLGRAKGMA